jgi:hypothetical protein
MHIKSRISESMPALDWNSLPLMLDEKYASMALGVSVSFLRKSRCEGARKKQTPAPPFVCIGGRRYYRILDLKSWVESLVTRQVI